MSNSVVSPNSAASNPPGHDIFCTPANSDFVSKVPYQSLSKTDHEVRLLKILPDSGSGFVECELLPPVSLANVQKQYLALSYCAGSAKNTKPIKVNGVNSNVFANLHHALTSARHYWKTNAELPEFLLWVDQICINQFDLAERSHQVGFMKNIYQNAKRTLICLSTEETDGEGMRWIAYLKDTVEYATLPPLRQSLDQMSQSKGFVEGLARFCDMIISPWWGRAWVFQEFMASTHATFLYGRYAMPHGDFGELAIESCRSIGLALCNRHSERRSEIQLEKHQCSGEQWSHGYDNVVNILMAKRKEPTPNDMEGLLLYTRDCQASDQRDKIYSILGLASPGYGIMPDYSPENDIRKLLIETTTRIITFEDSLSVLSNLGSYHESNIYGGHLPSWVIDWIHIRIRKHRWLIGDRDEKPGMTHFTDHKIKARTIDASFAAIPHPERPRSMTTVLQIWAIFLDTDFQKVKEPPLYRLLGLSRKLYEGSQHYKIVTDFPVESGHELWILCGAREPFLLVEYSYGYRILSPVRIDNAVTKDGATKLPQFMDDQGMYDTSKMDWKKITLF